MGSQVVRSAFKQAATLSSSSVRPASILPSSIRTYSSTPSSSSPTPAPNASEPHNNTSASAHRPTLTPQPTNLPGSNLPSAHPTRYSPFTVSIVTKLAKLFGYHSQTSTAIRTTSDYYDRCAERGEIEAPFWYEECSLPPSFQTWFSITTLHVWLLSVRFRSLPSPLGHTYVQEFINHMFIDMELRIRGPYAVTQGRLIKGYMKDMLEQYHGSIAAYDEGLVRGDAVLAAALWRNMFGGGWGGVGGVKGKRAPKAGEAPKLGPNPLQVEATGPTSSTAPAAESTNVASTSSSEPLAVDPIQAKLLKKGADASSVFTTDAPLIDPKTAAAIPLNPLYPEDPDLEFVQSLEKIVKWVRKEVQRLERLPDQVVMQGLKEGKGPLVDFTRI
ncbi:Cbp3p [Sporobolomyces salmoneus]|uniref:Cbp3p n=1 Tax=Sporobolomyces salmoneus TaxID=183962 RepID=UPI003177D51E